MSKHRYRSKVVIDAVQWDGTNAEEVKEFLGQAARHYAFTRHGDGMNFMTDWGTVHIKKGDFVTRDDDGHVSNNSAETFATYYERVEVVA
jgi:hypothetical protein